MSYVVFANIYFLFSSQHKNDRCHFFCKSRHMTRDFCTQMFHGNNNSRSIRLWFKNLLTHKTPEYYDVVYLCVGM